jgi:vitamin B12/bleomycin/antimicrobial peptide transport system ATP-binding/permease protein
MRLLPQFAFLRDHHLFARFLRSAEEVWRAKRALFASLAVFLVVVVLLQLLVQVLLNLWNRNFFDALERKDGHALWLQAQLFVPLAATSILLAATSVWGRMTAQRKWREAMTRQVLDRWLEHDRFQHLNHHMVKGSENPEYRIVVDIRIATDAPIDLTLAFFSSIITSITFFGVLWSIGGGIEFPLLGMSVRIPGYLVFGVIIYSGAVTALMMFFGHHLTSIIERMNQSEAEFRAAADAFRVGGEQEANVSDADKRQTVQLKLRAVLLWWREFCWQLVRTTLVSHGNFLFSPVVAWFLCAPKYLTGAMSLGELTQAAAAFVVVQGAFNWLVDNYQRVADWRSSAHRVATLLLALDELETNELATSAPQR